MIDGKYPIISNWLITKKKTDGMYQIENAVTDEKFLLDEEAFRFLRGLDGRTDPRKIGQNLGLNIDKTIKWLDERSLIRIEGRKYLSYTGVYYHTLFIPRKHRSKSMIPKIYNYLLLISWLPVLLLGIWQFAESGVHLYSYNVIPGYIIFLLLGMLVHELSHLLSGLAYKGYAFEIGVGWYYVFPLAYVLMKTNHIKSRLRRVQIEAAGVESNLMLAGICFLLSTVSSRWSGFFFVGAIINMLLGLCNLVFVAHIDGYAIIRELLGVGNLNEIKRIIRRKRKKVNKSINDKAALLTCGILLFYQILLPLFILNNILILIGELLCAIR